MACVAWAEANNVLVDGSPGGAAFKHGAHKARGFIVGRSDLLVLEPGGDGSHGLAVELKLPGNKLSAEQRAYFARIRARGWRVRVAFSLAEFIAMVRTHIDMRPPPGSGSVSDPIACDSDDCD